MRYVTIMQNLRGVQQPCISFQDITRENSCCERKEYSILLSLWRCIQQARLFKKAVSDIKNLCKKQNELAVNEKNIAFCSAFGHAYNRHGFF